MELIDPYTIRDPSRITRAIETIQRVLSITSPLGRCQECAISWQYRDPMPSVAYSAEGGAFPLCQRCYDALDAEAVTTHFQRMWLTEWERDPDANACRTFYENVRDRKEQDTADYTHD